MTSSEYITRTGDASTYASTTSGTALANVQMNEADHANTANALNSLSEVVGLHDLVSIASYLRTGDDGLSHSLFGANEQLVPGKRFSAGMLRDAGNGRIEGAPVIGLDGMVVDWFDRNHIIIARQAKADAMYQYGARYAAASGSGIASPNAPTAGTHKNWNRVFHIASKPDTPMFLVGVKIHTITTLLKPYESVRVTVEVDTTTGPMLSYQYEYNHLGAPSCSQHVFLPYKDTTYRRPDNTTTVVNLAQDLNILLSDEVAANVLFMPSATAAESSVAGRHTVVASEVRVIFDYLHDDTNFLVRGIVNGSFEYNAFMTALMLNRVYSGATVANASTGRAGVLGAAVSDVPYGDILTLLGGSARR